jgi:hypothetical protein
MLPHLPNNPLRSLPQVVDYLVSCRACLPREKKTRNVGKLVINLPKNKT